MRFAVQAERRGLLLRCWGRGSGEIAWSFIGLRGLRFDVEFPSDWHEQPRMWIRLCFGFVSVNFSLPWWGKIVPDDGQCSGPTYGFYFFGDSLVLEYGKTHGRRGDPQKHIQMPWGWRFQREWKEGGIEVRQWTRPWIPWRMTRRTIAVEFNEEVGERTGSWKGGVLGCGDDMKAGETRLECLRRMERERRFHR